MLALRMPLDVRRNLMLPPGVVLQARTCRRLRIRRRDSQTTENSSAPEPASRLQGHFERGLREDSCSKRRAEAGSSSAKRPREMRTAAMKSEPDAPIEPPTRCTTVQ